MFTEWSAKVYIWKNIMWLRCWPLLAFVMLQFQSCNDIKEWLSERSESTSWQHNLDWSGSNSLYRSRLFALKMLDLVFIVICMFVTSSCGHHYLISANSSTDCPSFNQCHTLSEITQHPKEYFLSHTTVELLPGLHKLNNTGLIVISSLKNLTIIGSNYFLTSFDGYSYSESVVFCNNSGFYFQYTIPKWFSPIYYHNNFLYTCR